MSGKRVADDLQVSDGGRRPYEPPTMEVVPGRTCRNVYGGREFTCSECHTTWHVLRRDESGDWLEPGGFGFCPGCGARVVDA